MGGRAGSGKEWTLVGNTGSFGRAAKLQDMRTFCFMPGGQVVSGTEKGHLYVWEQPRDMAQELRYTDDGQEFLPLRWNPQGKLVVSVKALRLCPSHDSSLFAIN